MPSLGKMACRRASTLAEQVGRLAPHEPRAGDEALELGVGL
jgi:hypothetical protein